MKVTKTIEQAAARADAIATATEVRTRTRGALKPVTPEIEELARTVYLENLKQNEAKRNHDGARKNLFEYMRENKIAPFEVEIADEVGGEPTKIRAYIDTPPATYISVDDLFRLIPDKKTLMKVLSATKTAVVEHVGSIVATKATRVGTGTTNVFVKPVEKK